MLYLFNNLFNNAIFIYEIRQTCAQKLTTLLHALFYCFAENNFVPNFDFLAEKFHLLLLSVTISSFRQEEDGNITSRNSVSTFNLYDLTTR